MSTTIPTTISICIATTLSCFTLFTLTSDQDRVDMQTASDGFAQSIKILSPTTIGDQCWQIDDRFAKHLPDGSIWTVEINQDDEDCDQAKLQIQLPESNTTFVPVSPTATNITLKEGTVTWSESLNHSDIESPYKARLVGAQTAPDRCLILKCGGDVRGVDITPAIASLTNAIDNVKPITGNLLELETNATNDPSLDLGGRCENESAKVTIYNDRTKLAEVNCNCSNSEDNTEAKAKTATTTKIETKTTTDTKQESKCSWAYEVSIVHGNTYQFNVTESDWINNISPATANFEVTVDTEAPRVSALTLAPKILTKNKEAEVTLTFSEAIADFESDKHITIQNGTLTTMERKDVEGKKWTGTLTPENDIVAIDNVVKVNGAYIDIAGNIGSPYQSESYIIDTRDLAAPSFSLDKDTGISNADNITYNRQVNVNTDVVVPGAKWKYSLDSGQNWEVSSDSKMFFLAENAKYEPGSIQVQQISEFGNLGTISKNPEKIIIDNMRPAPPSLALVNDTGRYSNDNITSDAKVSVEIEQNASWQYRHKKAQDWQDGSDKNFFELIPNTTYKKDDIHVIQTDVAGNNSDKDSNQADFIIDNIAPVPLGFTIADDTGTNATDNITNNPQMNINSAVLEPDAIWHYSLDAGKSWTEGSGYHFDLNPGTYLAGDIQVTQTDLAGNTSPVTNQEYKTPTLYLLSGAGSSDSDSSDGNDKYFSPVNEEPIFFDDTPPTSTISFALNKDTGSSSTDFITKNPQMDVRIEAMEEGAIWEYSVDKGESWQTSKFDNHFYLIGNRTYPAKHVQARVTDIAGNSGTVFKHPQQIIIDNKAPNPPSFELDYYTESDDHFISQSTQINVFNLEPGAIGQYQINSADNDDNWVTVLNESPWFIFDLKQNQKYNIGEIKVRQIDEAGNISDSNTNQVTFVIDNEEPPAPSFTLAHDTGISNKDNITQNPLVNVAVEENAIWHYRAIVQQTAGENTIDSWKEGSGASFMLPSDNGKYKIQLKQRDRAGNVSPIYSSNDIITIDNTAPAQVLTFALDEDTGISDRDNITQSRWLRINNISELNGELPWEYRLGNGNNWISGDKDTILLEKNTVYQAGSIQLRHYDMAGNPSRAFSNSDKITIDNEAPSEKLSFALRENTGIRNSDTLIRTRNPLVVVDTQLLEEKASWQYSLDGGEIWANGTNGRFVLRDHEIYLADKIQVRQVDLAGNHGPVNSNKHHIKIDTIPPYNKLSFKLDEDTGVSDSDYITSNPLIVIDTKLLDGIETIWQYSLNGGKNWEDGANGQFTLDESGVYATGSIQVRQVDFAGNLGPIYSNRQAIEVDTIRPDSLSFTLEEDTGIRNNDYFTQNPKVIVDTKMLENDARWEYSSDGGKEWAGGANGQFELGDNEVYATGSIQVRQVDLAGNLGHVYSNKQAIKIDNNPPTKKLYFYLQSKNVVGWGGMNFTQNPLVNVGTNNLEKDAIWRYSLDGGNNWVDGANSQFMLSDNMYYDIGSIQVRQVDFAGNLGPVYSNHRFPFVIDNLAPTFPSNKVVVSLDKSAALRWNIASLPNTFAEDENKVFYRVSGKDSALIEDMVYTKNGQEVLSTYIFKSNIYKDDTKKYTYNFIVTAYDMAGNTAEQEFTVYINFPPTWREIEYSCDSKIGIQKIGSVCQAGWHNGVESTSCDVDSDPARTIQCAKDGTWSEWSDWSRCSDKGVTCGGTPGKQFRTRECSATRGGRCETNGPTTETRSCTLPYCSLVNEKHNDKHCEDLGGRVTRVFEGLYDAKYICAFSRSSCPSGWKQYKNWSITEPSSCWIQSSKTWCGGFTGKGDGCTTTYHKFFRDIPPETCTYTKIQSISAGLLKRDCTSVDYTCTAKIKEIACY
jgi:hypothetical protein